MEPRWAILIALVAWLGHAFAWTVVLNYVYSYPIHRRLQRSSRVLVGVAVLAFPAAAYWFLRRVVAHELTGLEALGVGYLAGCVFIALVLLPIATVLRWLRRDPPAIEQRTSRIHDFAQEFPTKPLGRGEHWRLARLPGNQLLQVEFTEMTLRLPRLPASWHGLSVLHVSDLHFHGSPEREFFERVIDRCLEWGTPDIVCITGDLIDTNEHAAWIQPLLGRLRWREAGFAILGNHDYWTDPQAVRHELTRAGFVVLGNVWHEVTVRGEPLVAIGHEGPWFRPGPDMALVPGAGFRLLLSHTPDNIRWAKFHGVDFMLSGHVHGGQVRIPVLGSLFVPSRFSRRYDQGVFWEPPTLLSVTRGLSGREPLRWNCRPEVSWYRFVADTAPTLP